MSAQIFQEIANQRTIERDIRRQLYHINRLIDGQGKLLFEYDGTYKLLHQHDNLTTFYRSLGTFPNKGQFNRALESILQVLKISKGNHHEA